jgi:hypothetical protein
MIEDGTSPTEDDASAFGRSEEARCSASAPCYCGYVGYQRRAS